MKSLYKIFIILFFGLNISFAQSSDIPTMTYWQGGELYFDFNFGVNTTGVGRGSGTFFGSVISPRMRVSSVSVFRNPAELGLLKYNTSVFETKFGIGNNEFGLTSSDLVSEKDLSKNTDTFLKDTTTFLFKPGGFRKDMNLKDVDVGQLAQVSSFSIAGPFPAYKKLFFGFGVYYPFSVSMKFRANGIRTKLESSKIVSDQEFKVDIVLNTNILNEMYLRTNVITLASAYDFGETKFGKFVLGVSANRYQVDHLIDFNIITDGMVVMNRTTEHHFNDPNDVSIDTSLGQSNEMYFIAKGNYKVTNWGYRVGLYYDPSNWLPSLSFMNLNFVLDNIPEFVMSDKDAYVKSFQPAFLRGTFVGEKEDAIDIDMGDLDPARPNLTRPTHNEFSNEVRISLPSTFTFGMDFSVWEHVLALNIVKYLTPIYYKFGKYKFGKSADLGIKMGADIKLADELKGWGWALVPLRLLYLDLDGILLQLFRNKTGYSNPHYRLGGGIVFGDKIVEGFVDKDQKQLLEDALSSPLPVGFAMGREYTILNNIGVGVVVFGFPDFALRYSLEYRF